MRFPFFPLKNPPPEKSPPIAFGLSATALRLPEASLRADLFRSQILNLALGFGFFTTTLGLVWVGTHHTIQPYVLQEGKDGAVQLAKDTLVPYEPRLPEKHYFVAQWVKHLLSLDVTLSEEWLKEAYQQTRGKASIEFTDWIKQEAPLQALKSDPSLTRNITISSISILDHDVALVRVLAERRSLSNPSAKVDRWLVTLHFKTQALTDEAAILKNPIGLLVTDFQIGEDLEK